MEMIINRRRPWKDVPVLILATAIFLGAGCNNPTVKKGVQMFQDLSALQGKLAKEFSVPNVGVRIANGRLLNISLVNSQYNELPEKDRKQKAREIAMFVKNNYASMDKIEEIGVAFVVHKKIAFVINYANSLNSYRFDKAELETDQGEETPSEQMEGTH